MRITKNDVIIYEFMSGKLNGFHRKFTAREVYDS